MNKRCAKRGIGDRDRVGVGGHSYGAFMSANLLARSELFACAIGRSGAYNRTLTPFGFQVLSVLRVIPGCLLPCDATDARGSRSRPLGLNFLV